MKNFDYEKYKCMIERKKVEREYKSSSFVTKKMHYIRINGQL